MSYTTIDVTAEGALATIRLDRPARMNAVIEAMYRELQDALAAIAADPDNRCVILTGSVRSGPGGDKQAFCAGADLKEHGAGGRSPAARKAYIELAHETVGRLFAFPRPVIAAINGPARGAGAEMALACDLVLMADEATIGLPETGLGTFVGGGLTHVLPRLVGLARARELIYTGRVLNGAEAQAIGLVLRSVPLERLATETRRLAETLASKAPRSLELAKKFLGRARETDFDSALRAEAAAILSCMETDDWAEGIRAFAEKRPPIFRGR